MIEGVVGVTIWTEDLERLVRFYRDTLGLELHRHHGDFANFVFGNVRLNLGAPRPGERPGQRPLPRNGELRRPGHPR